MPLLVSGQLVAASSGVGGIKGRSRKYFAKFATRALFRILERDPGFGLLHMDPQHILRLIGLADVAFSIGAYGLVPFLQ